MICNNWFLSFVVSLHRHLVYYTYAEQSHFVWGSTAFQSLFYLNYSYSYIKLVSYLSSFRLNSFLQIRPKDKAIPLFSIVWTFCIFSGHVLFLPLIKHLWYKQGLRFILSHPFAYLQLLAIIAISACPLIHCGVM